MVALGFFWHLGASHLRKVAATNRIQTADTCSWEELSTTQISQVIEHIRSSAHLEKRIQSLHYDAGRMAIQGLHAYGWPLSELSAGGTTLMNLIGKHVDILRLREQNIVPIVVMPSSLPGDVEWQETVQGKPMFDRLILS